jgi:FkbM family methyltransferase
MRTVPNGPLLFRVARRMTRSNLSGGGFLMRTLGRFGVLNAIAEYQFGRVRIGVPLSKLKWDFSDVASYERRLIDTFCEALVPLKDVTLFDCGADIGTFSCLVVSRAQNVRRILAFEPNADVQVFLRTNISNLPLQSQVVAKAVSSFEGRGKLERAPYDPTDHARFLVPGDGPIEVIKIDSMNVRGGDIAIKVDIEGAELDALRGAAETLASARRCVVVFEANHMVGKRIGRDPVECLKFLESLRPFNFVVAETGEHPSTPGPLLRSGQTEIWNVVGCASNEASLAAAATQFHDNKN